MGAKGIWGHDYSPFCMSLSPFILFPHLDSGLHIGAQVLERRLKGAQLARLELELEGLGAQGLVGLGATFVGVRDSYMLAFATLVSAGATGSKSYIKK